MEDEDDGEACSRELVDHPRSCVKEYIKRRLGAPDCYRYEEWPWLGWVGQHTAKLVLRTTSALVDNNAVVA